MIKICYTIINIKGDELKGENRYKPRENTHTTLCNVVGFLHPKYIKRKQVKQDTLKISCFACK